jgi:hypothetical protein
MKNWLLAIAFACLMVPGAILAQGESGIRVEEMVFCTAVQDRAPAGVDTAFASTVENVCCFVRVTGAADTTSITHVWYYMDRETARVELAVKASSWRTWSSKKIAPEWQGTWRVDVLGPSGDVLKSGTFAVKP